VNLSNRRERGPVTGELSAGPSDERILDLIVAGHQHAFDVIVARYGARVRRFIHQVAGHDAPAEDLAQTAFIKVFKAVDRFDGKHSFASWLFKISHNVTVDWLRSEQARRRHLDAHEEDSRHQGVRTARSPLQDLEHREFAEHLTRAMRELPEVHRSAFLLREQEEMSYEEIADALGISPKTVSSRIHRARKHLRRQLAPFLDEGGRGSRAAGARS
jgi:RNA polymerase sigma-70 factor (ECF subfamily)